MGETGEIVELPRQIRDQQAETLRLERERQSRHEAQLARVDRIHDRAGAIQDRAARVLRTVGLAAVPLLLLLLALLPWPLLSRKAA